MKRIAFVLALCAIFVTGCGDTADDASSAVEIDKSLENVEYVIEYPTDKLVYEEIAVSQEDTAEFDAVYNAVLENKTNDPSLTYSKEEASDSGMSGGMPTYIHKSENGEIISTMTFLGYNSEEVCTFNIGYPNDDLVGGFSSDVQTYSQLRDAIKDKVETVGNALHS